MSTGAERSRQERTDQVGTKLDAPERKPASFGPAGETGSSQSMNRPNDHVKRSG